MYLSKADCKELLDDYNKDVWCKLRQAAFEKKVKFYGKEIFLRGVVEFSNHCRKNCKYCGLRKDSDITRYRLEEPEILNQVSEIFNSGIRTVVLQSGEDIYYTKERLVSIIKKIKKNYDIAITLCVGERSVDDYKAFFDAGASRFLIKHETSNENLYASLHPGETLKDRLKLFEELKKIGYQVGLGNIVGLPYTTVEDYINDIFLMKELDADMAAIGPFIPSKFSPLSNFPHASTELVIKINILARIILENVNMPATTALYSIGNELAIKEAILSGANVVMPNFTPEEKRRHYKIYDLKTPLTISLVKEIANKVGCFISENRGDRNYAKCA